MARGQSRPAILPLAGLLKWGGEVIRFLQDFEVSLRRIRLVKNLRQIAMRIAHLPGSNEL